MLCHKTIFSIYDYLSTFQLTNIYGNIYTVWLGTTPVIVLNGYKAVKDGLVTNTDEITGRPLTPFFKDLMGERGNNYTHIYSV